MRALCLGLEVVTPDGRVWDGLRPLRKDNSGYALRELYIGSEGTLGLITAAVLQLFPPPADRSTALVSLAGPEAAVALLRQARRALGDRLTACELMSPATLARLPLEMPTLQVPAIARSGWALLIEATAPTSALETFLAHLLESGLAGDAVLATSLAQARALWAVREAVPLVQSRLGAALRFDVSVPIARIPAFLRVVEARLAQAWPDLSLAVFGHVGDGNLHVNVRPRDESAAASLEALRGAVDRLVLDLVQDHGGSIAAEHGIGQARCRELPERKSPVEMSLMQAIKRALDPERLMNPGKLFPWPDDDTTRVARTTTEASA
jgi:FAD/FMN-containing dehydrogenase